MLEKAAEGIRRAEEAPAVPAPTQADIAAWQRRELVALAKASAEKIARLEQDQYDLIHDKFGLLLTEDSVKSHIQDCLIQPGLEDDLRRFAERKYLRSLPLLKRMGVRARFRRLRRKGQVPPELEEQDVLNLITGQLARLGWPLGKKVEDTSDKGV